MSNSIAAWIYESVKGLSTGIVRDGCVRPLFHIDQTYPVEGAGTGEQDRVSGELASRLYVLIRNVRAKSLRWNVTNEEI